MKVITISNHKGGVAKTTTAAAIASALSGNEKRVLMIDLDAQQNLTDIFLRGYNGRTIYDAITDRHSLPIVPVQDNVFLSIVPASEDLIAADIDFAGKKRREAILKELIQKEAKDFDFVIIDTPPALGLLTIMALCACNSLIIPSTAERFSLNGLQRLLKAVHNIKEAFGAEVELTGILLTRMEATAAHAFCEEQLRQFYKEDVFTTKIRKNTKVVDSQLANMALQDYAPRSTAATDYRAFMEELMKRL